MPEPSTVTGIPVVIAREIASLRSGRRNLAEYCDAAHTGAHRAQRWPSRRCGQQSPSSPTRGEPNRRNQIENLNGILRNKGGLEDRWCHVFGDAARFVGSEMMGVAYLLRETKLDWLNSTNGDRGSEDPDGDNETASGDLDDEPVPQLVGDNSADRSRDGPN